MSKASIGEGARKRCYLIAPAKSGAGQVATFLAELGLEVTRAVEGPTNKTISDELLRHLAEVDFVIAIMPPVQSAGVLFELGMAYALRKPALVLGIGEQEPNLSGVLRFRGVEFIRLPDLRHLDEVKGDVDRFARISTSLRPTESGQPGKPTAPPVGDFGWARKRLQALRSTTGPRRGFRFEELVAEIFRRADGDVEFAGEKAAAVKEYESDLIVWLNDLAFEVGGPIIVECKVYRGGTGSVVKNLEHAIQRLDRLVGRTNSGIALVVYDHDRRRTPPSLNETPRVLAYAAESLIDNLEKGTLVADVAKRRRLAAFRTGASDDST
ncbi:hypothetical protein [Pelagibius marinus]|uniref:hypothetical protein n=1 Tax=Pelagibius marinus TaxID=2762760 RepID=UPI0018723710|nr:hypothetical protein [Pelagibius marinus]